MSGPLLLCLRVPASGSFWLLDGLPWALSLVTPTTPSTASSSTRGIPSPRPSPSATRLTSALS
eukprot:CAMPEP_0202874924 /NCGR_PEP_ID=MMETSP1391-20130828/26262_1 /ASSEMBLY_ACC=CAM_ASM_000867 /TAXON_ID=1034604 /ORGANISM="Chlamydomonas leiostraca, Strain SAG 11-49" /LENGTH=62 /DNA_ID=CAMNT_0049556471 /DNA_START=18 /DNA_END=203 /DNA_ORIENTATION=+